MLNHPANLKPAYKKHNPYSQKLTPINKTHANFFHARHNSVVPRHQINEEAVFHMGQKRNTALGKTHAGFGGFKPDGVSRNTTNTTMGLRTSPTNNIKRNASHFSTRLNFREKV